MELRCPLCRGPLEAAEPRSACPACGTAYHPACQAELGVACATLGCPVASPPPVVLEEPASPLWPLVFTWLLFGVVWQAGLLTWVWAVARARVHPRFRVWAALLASPFVAIPLCTAADAVQGYVRGTAVITLPPERWTSSTGLDPLVRCEEVHGGRAIGPELLSRGTNVLVLHDLARHFGPMTGGYDGPIPTGDEARVLLASALPGALSPDGRWVTDALGRRVDVELGQLGREILGYHPAGPEPVRLAWLDERSLLIAPRWDSTEVLLCDLRARRPVARVLLGED